MPELTTLNDPLQNKTTFPEHGYVRLKQILGPNGPLPISRSGFWAGVKTGKFPKPRKISARVTVWRAEDILMLLQKIEQGNT
ncbi:AlpA family phage regulatory protein [Rhizobium leguminosarum]|nr:AlpA family phage regulatory protein [Rhizobium leguminosarum]